mgnify:CR=1 FL=1
MKEITLKEAEELETENSSIGYYIDYRDFTLKQVMDIAKGEFRIVAQISNFKKI